MLKHNEVNPLAVFGLREVKHCPPHFTPVLFELRANEKTISDWIWANLTGRFYCGERYYRDNNNNVHAQFCSAFEIPAEASMFALVIDQINTFNFEF
jgi:hypothetical protein